MTKRFAPRARRGSPPLPPTRFEIALSTTLLFQTFQDVERTVRVNGQVISDASYYDYAPHRQVWSDPIVFRAAS